MKNLLNKFVIKDLVISKDFMITDKSRLNVTDNSETIHFNVEFYGDYIDTILAMLSAKYSLSPADIQILKHIIKKTIGTDEEFIHSDLLPKCNYTKTTFIKCLSNLEKAGLINKSWGGFIYPSFFLKKLIQSKKEIRYVVIEINNHDSGIKL